jgi:hypothetical protein
MGAVNRFGECRRTEKDLGRHPGMSVFSPTCITLGYNKKIRTLPDRENSFSGASGGGNDTCNELSLVPASDPEGPTRNPAQI